MALVGRQTVKVEEELLFIIDIVVTSFCATPAKNCRICQRGSLRANEVIHRRFEEAPKEGNKSEEDKIRLCSSSLMSSRLCSLLERDCLSKRTADSGSLLLLGANERFSAHVRICGYVRALPHSDFVVSTGQPTSTFGSLADRAFLLDFAD